MIRIAIVLAVLILLVAPAARSAEESRFFDEALKTRDVRKWQRSLSILAGQDHPGAVRYLLLFFLAQRDDDGTKRPRKFYEEPLRRMRNPRSVRALADRLSDDDPRVVALVASALTGHPGLHIVDAELRVRYQKALRLRREEETARYLGLLRGRLHVLDRPWVRKAVTSRQTTGIAKAALLGAYADPELSLTPAAGVADAEKLEAALTPFGADADPDDALQAIEGLGVRDLVRALRVVYARRVRAVLAAAPMRDLFRLHELNTRLRLSRTYRRDLYFHPRYQRQPWDRNVDGRKMTERPEAVDFGDPAVAGAVEGCLLVKRLIDGLSGERAAPVVGTPWHPDLFALNRLRRRAVDTIVFTPGERDELVVREWVLRSNRSFPAVSERERKNVNLVNAYRLAYALPLLRIDATLTTCARNHSRFQLRMGKMTHEFKDVREPYGRTPADRMAKAGYPPEHGGGENVLVGTQNPAEAFDWWRKSPGHRRNMLGRWWTEIGVGEASSYWTQNFGSRPVKTD